MNTGDVNYSVLMSVYYKDNKDWLIESVESMLNQTIKTNDFVIVKDGKLNNDLDLVISEYCKKYSDIFNVIELKENVGLGPALAIGVKKCKNEFIARMDSDDISREDRIEKELKIIQEKNIDMVGSNIAEFTGSIENIRAYRGLPQDHDDIIKFSKRRNPFGHPSMLLKKSKIVEAGNYRSFYLCEDYDMWIRMFKIGCKAYNIQENLVYMRIGEDFYKRRGGIKYLKSILKFKKEQYKNGYYKLKDYLITSCASIVTCLMPNYLREMIYKKLLRGKK